MGEMSRQSCLQRGCGDGGGMQLIKTFNINTCKERKGSSIASRIQEGADEERAEGEDGANSLCFNCSREVGEWDTPTHKMHFSYDIIYYRKATVASSLYLSMYLCT